MKMQGYIESTREYTALVKEGKFPEQVTVPLDDRFHDDRGLINNLILDGVTSVARINSKAGTVRANHYHKTDWHYTFIESGHVDYYWRPVGSNESPEHIIFEK